RLYPITHTGPKQLVPIANKPVLDYAIDDLRDAGITEIGVILGNKGREAIQEHLGDGSEYGVDITYIVQGDPLGLAHAVGCARDFVGDDSFVVYLGDDLMREGIEDLVNDFDEYTYAAGIGLQEVEEPSRYGVVGLDDQGDVTELVEKPDDPPSNYALIGIYVFTPAIFEQIERLEPSWRGELEITDAIQGLLHDGHSIQSHIVHGWWKDTGKPEDVLHANRLVLDGIETELDGTVEDEESISGRIDLRDGAVIEEGAVVRGPVSIGEDTRIGSEAYIGPYSSIGANSEIDHAHIESSVTMGQNTITADRIIVDSLIGRQATITSNAGKQPDGDRMVIGRNSTLEL
ncbi:MAG: glucose-1-phosphate thymidylyltransferase, partial [Halobacteriaceae archaeon]